MHLLYDSTIRPACVLVAVLWLIGVAIVAYDRFLASDDIGFFGLVFIATGMMVQIRGYYLSIRSRLGDYNAAFEMGKAVGQQSAPVRPIR